MDVRSAVIRAGAAGLLAFGLSSSSSARTNDLASGIAGDIAILKALVAPKAARRATPVATPDAPTPPADDDARTVEAPASSTTVDDLASRPLIKGDLRTFDVSGFKLGMSPAEVQRVAAAARLVTSDGSRKLPFDPERHGTRGASFQLLVARAAAVRLNRPRPAGPTVVSDAVLYGAGDERYYLNFLPMEGGPRLASVMLISSPKGNTPQSYFDAVTAKYGKAPEAQVGAGNAFARWCTRGNPQCDGLPSFSARTSDREAVVSLTLGNRERISLGKRIEATGAAAAASAARKPAL